MEEYLDEWSDEEREREHLSHARHIPPPMDIETPIPLDLSEEYPQYGSIMTQESNLADSGSGDRVSGGHGEAEPILGENMSQRSLPLDLCFDGAHYEVPEEQSGPVLLVGTATQNEEEEEELRPSHSGKTDDAEDSMDLDLEGLYSPSTLEIRFIDKKIVEGERRGMEAAQEQRRQTAGEKARIQSTGGDGDSTPIPWSTSPPRQRHSVLEDRDIKMEGTATSLEQRRKIPDEEAEVESGGADEDSSCI